MLREVSKEDIIGCLPEREDVRFDVPFKAHLGRLGNFTVAVIVTKAGVYAGVSKRNPADLPSDTGYNVAIVRAWRAFKGKPAGYSRQHPVSKAEAKRIAVASRVLDVLDALDVRTDE